MVRLGYTKRWDSRRARNVVVRADLASERLLGTRNDAYVMSAMKKAGEKNCKTIDHYHSFTRHSIAPDIEK
jgi:hypothetical protein